MSIVDMRHSMGESIIRMNSPDRHSHDGLRDSMIGLTPKERHQGNDYQELHDRFNKL
jgi:hypothetical protein